MFERKDLNKSETWYRAKYYVQKYITVFMKPTEFIMHKKIRKIAVAPT